MYAIWTLCNNSVFEIEPVRTPATGYFQRGRVTFYPCTPACRVTFCSFFKMYIIDHWPTCMRTGNFSDLPVLCLAMKLLEFYTLVIL